MSPPRRADGFALVVVLWTLALLTVMAASFAFTSRTEIALATNHVDRARADAIAEAALGRGMVALLSRDRDQRWYRDGRGYAFRFGDGLAQVSIQSEPGLIDLNAADADLLRAAIEWAAIEAADGTAQRVDALHDALLDWRDPDSSRRRAGSEDADYEAAGVRYGARDGPLLATSELHRIAGWTSALAGAMASISTVHAGTAKVDPFTAPPDVLRALPGLDAATIDAWEAARAPGAERLSSAEQLALLAGAAEHLAPTSSPVFSITGEGRLDNGTRVRRRMTVLVTGRVKPAYAVLEWQTHDVPPVRLPAGVDAPHGGFRIVIWRFARWWFGELASLVPRWIRGSRESGIGTVRLRIDASEIVATHAQGAREREIVRIERPAGADERAMLAARLVGIRPESNRCELVLAPGLALELTTELPRAAEENLREVLGFEIDRRTPFRADEVLFGYRVDGGDRTQDTIEVALTVVPRALAREALDGLDGWDLVPDDQPPTRPTPPGGSPAIRLRSSRLRGSTSARFGTVLTVLNLALLAAVLTIPVIAQHRHLADLRTALEGARDRAEAASEVRDRIARLRGALGFVAGEKSRQPPVVVVLEELSVRLPDHTWVQRFHLRHDRLRVQGSSAEASSLIARIEASGMLSDPRFVSPVTRAPNSARERFHLEARVLEMDSLEPETRVEGAAGSRQ